MRKFTDVVLVPMTPEMASELRRRAVRDERPVAAYVRVLLAKALSKGTEADV